MSRALPGAPLAEGGRTSHLLHAGHMAARPLRAHSSDSGAFPGPPPPRTLAGHMLALGVFLTSAPLPLKARSDLLGT